LYKTNKLAKASSAHSYMSLYTVHNSHIIPHTNYNFIYLSNCPTAKYTFQTYTTVLKSPSLQPSARHQLTSPQINHEHYQLL